MNPFKELKKLEKMLVTASIAQRIKIRKEMNRWNHILMTNPGLIVRS